MGAVWSHREGESCLGEGGEGQAVGLCSPSVCSEGSRSASSRQLRQQKKGSYQQDEPPVSPHPWLLELYMGPSRVWG